MLFSVELRLRMSRERNLIKSNSDKPENHDFDLLRKLVFPDGSILRAKLPGRQTTLPLSRKFRAMEASRACWYFLARSPTSSTSSPTTTTPRTRCSALAHV
uniref:Uncharacterized protein n=1 Tax=Aegilops tauschii subsp. strangulata TaxID=200361 RepID=A0A453L3N8_AEGTS